VQLIAFQAQPSLQREGLPYWLFWFLLCIILLLIVFIFLRDKQLRVRLSSFLAGARRRSLLFRLKFQLKKESQKRGTLLRKLGEKAWGEDIPVVGSEFIRRELARLFDKRNAGQMEWKKAFADLERLHKELEASIRLHNENREKKRTEKSPFDELMKRKKGEEKALKKTLRDRERERDVAEVRREKEEIRKKIDEFEDALRDIEAKARIERRELERAIRQQERLKERIEHRFKDIEAQEETLFLSLGRLVEQTRVANQDLTGLYYEIDIVNHRISTLQNRIETLSGG
jgi:chromosome segregation ATPase